jgi:hypothetical protein
MEIISDVPAVHTVIELTFFYTEQDTSTFMIDADAGDLMNTDGRMVYIRLAEHDDLFDPSVKVPAEEHIIYLDKVRRSRSIKRQVTMPTQAMKDELLRELRLHTTPSVTAH